MRERDRVRKRERERERARERERWRERDRGRCIGTQGFWGYRKHLKSESQRVRER